MCQTPQRAAGSTSEPSTPEKWQQAGPCGMQEAGSRGDLGEGTWERAGSWSMTVTRRNVHKPATNKCRGIIRGKSPNLRGEGRAGAESCGRREAEIKWAEEGA